MSVREPGVNVRFFKEDVVHGVMSKSAGREVTIQKDFCEIRVAGQEPYFGPANLQMQERFPEEWAAYQRGAAAEVIGTPVRRWPQLTQSQVRHLEHNAIYTVEDMAAVSDGVLQNLGIGARKLREDAQKFLSLAQTAADLNRMEDLEGENASLKVQVEAMQKQMADLISRMPKPAEAKDEPESPEPAAEAPRRRKATA